MAKATKKIWRSIFRIEYVTYGKSMTQGNESLLQNDTNFPLQSRSKGLATYDL